MKCSDCVKWVGGYCEGVGERDWGFGWCQDPERVFEVDAVVDDDSGLVVRLKTGPAFGCVRFCGRKS